MNDKRPLKALQAVLLAYTRSEDLSRNANPKELFDELRDDWGRYITKNDTPRKIRLDSYLLSGEEFKLKQNFF